MKKSKERNGAPAVSDVPQPGLGPQAAEAEEEDGGVVQPAPPTN